MSEKGNFFQLDRTCFHEACKIGLNAAVAYIFLACGTDEQGRTSSWSTQSIEKYTGIGRGQAKRAIQQLVEAHLVEQLFAGRGITSRYRFRDAFDVPSVTSGKKPAQLAALEAELAEPAWIWLPNSLVTGSKNEIPPIERLRRAQDVLVLKSFIELYHQHELADRGGISWRVIRQTFKRKQFTERGMWTIWEFTPDTMQVPGTTPEFPVWTWIKEVETGAARNDKFWRLWETITRTGLIECVPHLVEADTDEAAIIYPCPTATGTDAEQQVGQAARDAANELMGESLGFGAIGRGAEDGCDFLPVDRAYQQVQMVGVYRLIYRPRTGMTLAWHARQHEYEKMAEGFRMLAADATEGNPLRNRVA